MHKASAYQWYGWGSGRRQKTLNGLAYPSYTFVPEISMPGRGIHSYRPQERDDFAGERRQWVLFVAGKEDFKCFTDWA